MILPILVLPRTRERSSPSALWLKVWFKIVYEDKLYSEFDCKNSAQGQEGNPYLVLTCYYAQGFGGFHAELTFGPVETTPPSRGESNEPNTITSP